MLLKPFYFKNKSNHFKNKILFLLGLSLNCEQLQLRTFPRIFIERVMQKLKFFFRISSISYNFWRILARLEYSLKYPKQLFKLQRLNLLPSSNKRPVLKKKFFISAKVRISTHNHSYNILRFFDGWANFPFTTSEVKRDY